MRIIYGIGTIAFTIILNVFFERYVLKNNNDLLLYLTKCYKDKSLILITLIELILEIVMGFNTFFIYYYFVLYIMYKICEIDIKTKTINTKLLIILTIIALISVVVNNNGVISDKVLTCVISLIIFMLLSKITKDGFGMGDAQIIGVLGFIFGLQGLMAVLILASVLVFVVSIGMIIKSFSNRKKDIPFTPFLLISVIALLIYNNIL